MFQVKGKLLAHPEQTAYVIWEDGTISGTIYAVGSADWHAFLLDGERVGPEEGPYTMTNHLSSGLSALILITAIFVPGTLQLSGDVPVRPPVPEGAIG